jgi:hypothetical protein
MPEVPRPNRTRARPRARIFGVEMLFQMTIFLRFQDSHAGTWANTAIEHEDELEHEDDLFPLLHVSFEPTENLWPAFVDFACGWR